MQQFISNVIQFFLDIVNYVYAAFSNYNGGMYLTPYTNFLGKQILDGDMISTPLTFGELLRYVIPIVFVFIILWLFIRFFLKLLKVITG